MSDTTCGVCRAKTDAFACRRCTDRLERALGDFPALMTELFVTKTRQTRIYRAGARAERPVEPPTEPDRQLPAWLRSETGRIALRAFPMPVNLDAAELQWVARNTLTTWARHLAESRGATVPTDEFVLSWLLVHVDAVRWDEAAAEIIDEITYLHDQIERAVDRSPSRIYAGPCSNPNCVQPGESGEPVPTDLYAPWRPSDTEDEDHRDEKEFTCDGHRSPHDGCGQTYTWAARRPWLAAAIREQNVTLEDLISALPDLFPDLPIPPQGSLRGWVRDGRLMDHGPDRLGRRLFKGSEALDLIAQYKPKRFAPRRRRNAA